MLRLPDGMREKIATVAKDNNRSMNAEIVARLASSFAQEEQAGAKKSADELRALVQYELKKFMSENTKPD